MFDYFGEEIELKEKIYDVSEKNIWSFRQNNPELVIQDAAKYLALSSQDQETLRTILLARGINKWLKVRRDIIAYKGLVKIRIKELIEEIKIEKAKLQGDRTTPHHKLISLRSELKALEDVRRNLRQMCHSERMVIWPHSVRRDTLKKMNTIKVGQLIN
jgi:hypothetical protein